MMPALFFSAIQQYILLQASHPPDTSEYDTYQKLLIGIGGSVIGYVVNLLFTKRLNKADEYESEEQKQFRADVKEMKEWRGKTDERILKLEIQTENGIKGLNEKLGVVSNEVGEVKRMMGDFRETLAGLTSYLQKRPRSSN